MVKLATIYKPGHREASVLPKDTTELQRAGIESGPLDPEQRN